MNLRITPNANIHKTDKGYLLKIPAGDSSAYRFAQIDDYAGLARKNFPHHSLTFSLRAKTSAFPLAGTWGFGLWNDPFGMSLGFGGTPFRLPALPNAVWFFGASKENYLSFGGRVAASRRAEFIEAETSGVSRPPANGFIAQSFRSPKFDLKLILAGLVFPFSRKLARKFLGKIIKEDAISLESNGLPFEKQEQSPALHSTDPTQWHSYKLEWNQNHITWYVDDAQVFESQVSPNPPLGLVIWIDNQFASFTPDGKIGFGVLENEEAWLEIEDLKLN